MNSAFYQACYTRLGEYSKKEVSGHGISSGGYQRVNCSPDMPSSVLNCFETRRKISSPKTQTFYKEHLLAFFCESNVFGIEHIRTDLVDDSGRNIHFNQTFLMPDAYDVLKEPKHVIYISDANFGIDDSTDTWEDKQLLQLPEGLTCWCLRKTKNIPESLKLLSDSDQNLDLDQIAEKYGMDKEKIYKFIQCVYFHVFSTNASRNIFVRTDGSRECLRDMMYLLLTSIPFSMRLKVSAGEYGYENQKGCCVFFTDRIPDNETFIDPFTGNNNVFKGKQEEFFGQRFPFIHEAAQLNNEGRKEYFLKLEEMCKMLGVDRTQDQQCLRLAHQLIFEEYNKPEIATEMLYDILSLPLEKNKMWEKCVTILLTVVVDNSMPVPETTAQMISKLLQDDADGEYSDILIKYEAIRLIQSGTDESVHTLVDLEGNTEKFALLRSSLLESKIGREILTQYYESKFRKLVASNNNIGITDLINAGRSVQDLPDNQRLFSILKEKTKDLFADELRNGNSRFTEIQSSLAETLYQIDNGLYQQQSDETLYEFRKLFNDLFWESMKEDVYEAGEYTRFYNTYGKEFPEGSALLGALNALDREDYEKVIQYLKYDMPKQDQNRILKYMLRRIKKYEENGNFAPMELWAPFSKAVHENVVELMVRTQAGALFEDRLLEHVLDHEREIWTDSFFQNFYESVKAITRKDPELKKRLKNSLAVLEIEKSHRKVSGKANKTSHKPGFFRR